MSVVTVPDGDGSPINLHCVGDTYWSAGYPGIREILRGLPTLEARQDDVWICGFPKTGSNWLSELTGMILYNEPYYHTKGRHHGCLERQGIKAINSLPSPRLINNHFSISMFPEDVFRKDCKILCTIRNPKDIAVSLYHHLKGVAPYGYEGTFSGFLSMFYQGKVGGSGTTWFDHVPAWWKAHRNNPNVLYIFYEEMKQDLVGHVRRIASFLDKENSEEFYQKVAELCSFDALAAEMRSREPSGLWKSKSGSFYRKGVVDDWRNYMTSEQSIYMDEVYGRAMEEVPDLKARISFE